MSILISLSPNTEPDDVRATWRTLLTPYTWRDKKKIDSLKKEISEFFNYRSVTFTSSGRRALYDILKAYNIGEGDEVILQAFTCIAVPSGIKWAKAKPVYADIDADNYNIDINSIREKITGKTRAIIVQHTFGIPADILAVRDIAREHNIILIEDCAHALGATYKGLPVGTFSDIAFLSFGRDKPLSSVFGGAVVSEDQDIVRKIESQQESLAYPPFYWIIQQLFHPIAFNYLKPLYFTYDIGKIILVILQKIRLLSKAVAPQEKISFKPSHFNYRFSPALCALLSLQFSKFKMYTERRRHIAARYLQELDGLDIKMPNVDELRQPAWLRFPVQVTYPSGVLKAAKEEGMILGDWYQSALAPNVDEVIFGYKENTCPQAERAAHSVINLPTYPTMTDKEVDQVIEFMKKNI